MTDAYELHLLPRQHERLRRLAVALVGDEHGAEDLVQDAWLRALERGPREPAALGAWLGAVVRRLASNSRRGRRRRGERERAVARGEALPSSADIAARVEVEMGLYAALEALEEPHRTVLRDRYLGELSPAQLAARDGLSLEAVKSRLRRARAALRASLEREGLEGEPDWRHALAPLVLGPAALPTAASSTAVLIGSTVIMKKLSAIAALVVVAAGIVAWQVVVQGPGKAAQPEPIAPAAEPVAAGPAETRPADAPAGEPATPDEPAASRVALETGGELASSWTVTGRVRRAGGGHVAGLALTLAMYRGFELTGERLGSYELVSDADGRFALPLDPPDETVCFDITVEEEPGRRVVDYAPYVAVRDEGPPAPLDVLVFVRDARVEGVVLGPGGRPVSGAEIEAWAGSSATTGPDGGFSMDVYAGGKVRMTACAPGLGEAECVVDDLEPGGVARVEIALPPGAVLRGRVTDTDGRPLADAEVSLSGDSRRDARTAADGRYEIDCIALRSGARVQVSVLAEGHLSDSRSLPLDAATAEYTADFELTPGVRVHGRVLDPDGAPVAGAEVWIGWDPHAWDRIATRTDDEGRFTLEGVRPGPSKWGASKPGYAEAMREADLRNGDELVLTLERPRTLRGVARDGDGDPIAGLSVTARQDQSYVGEGSRTDADGAFELRGLPPRGGLRLEAYGSGWVRTHLPVDEGTADGVVLTVPRAGVLAGRVVDAETGAPVESFTVRLSWPAGTFEGEAIDGFESSWGDPGRSFDDAEGRWSTDDHDEFQPGVWAAFEVSAPGYATRRIDPAQVSPAMDVTEHVVELVPPLRVEVSVLEEPGDVPIVGARVEALPPDVPGRSEPVASGVTGAAGLALLEGLAPGPIHLRVRREGRADLRFGPFELPEGRSQATLELRVPAGQPLEVRVQERNGAPVADARVLLMAASVPDVEAGARLYRTTDAEGLARFDGLAPGAWNVGRAVGEGEWPAQDLRRTVEVAADEQPAEVVLAPVGDTTLIVRFEGDLEPPDGTVVNVGAPDGPPRAAVSREGEAVISGLGPGLHRVELSFWHPGTGTRARGRAEVELRPGDDTVELALEVGPR